MIGFSRAGSAGLSVDHHIDREVLQAVSLISGEEIEKKGTEKLYRELILIWSEIQFPVIRSKEYRLKYFVVPARPMHKAGFSC